MPHFGGRLGRVRIDYTGLTEAKRSEETSDLGGEVFILKTVASRSGRQHQQSDRTNERQGRSKAEAKGKPRGDVGGRHFKI
jgi:hypothetical protein